MGGNLGLWGRPEAEESGYYQIPLNLYRPGDLIEEDIYFLYQGNFLLYRVKNLIWKRDDLVNLEKFGIDHLFIRCSNDRGHQQFLESQLNRILNEPAIPTQEKAQILYETTRSIVEEVFDRPDSPDILKRSVSSIKHSIDYLSRDKAHFFELMSLAKKDFSEYTHALHTSAYAITLAHEIGIKAFNQVSAIGVASILHDIGKVRVDSQLLAKEDVLTEDERVEVERHPVYGYEIVHKVGTIPEISEQVILQHHERPNGAGYPYALKDDLHLFPRIVGLCDCFDLLTSERPYKKALTPFEAIEYLQHKAQGEYDENLIVSFIKMLRR